MQDHCGQLLPWCARHHHSLRCHGPRILQERPPVDAGEHLKEIALVNELHEHNSRLGKHNENILNKFFQSLMFSILD